MLAKSKIYFYKAWLWPVVVQQDRFQRDEIGHPALSAGCYKNIALLVISSYGRQSRHPCEFPHQVAFDRESNVLKVLAIGSGDLYPNMLLQQHQLVRSDHKTFLSTIDL